MCKHKDVETALIQLNDTLCRIAAALERMALNKQIVDFDDLEWDALINGDVE